MAYLATTKALEVAALLMVGLMATRVTCYFPISPAKVCTLIPECMWSKVKIRMHKVLSAAG